MIERDDGIHRLLMYIHFLLPSVSPLGYLVISLKSEPFGAHAPRRRCRDTKRAHISNNQLLCLEDGKVK